ncbi:IL6RA protein, partial [Polypterus senegalus]
MDDILCFIAESDSDLLDSDFDVTDLKMEIENKSEVPSSADQSPGRTATYDDKSAIYKYTVGGTRYKYDSGLCTLIPSTASMTCYQKVPNNNIRCEWTSQNKITPLPKCWLSVKKGMIGNITRYNCSYSTAKQKCFCILPHIEGDHDFYMVSLCVSNSVGSTSDQFSFHADKIVKPDPPINVSVQGVKTNTRHLLIQWSKPTSWKTVFYQLIYEVRYKTKIQYSFIQASVDTYATPSSSLSLWIVAGSLLATVITFFLFLARFHKKLREKLLKVIGSSASTLNPTIRVITVDKAEYREITMESPPTSPVDTEPTEDTALKVEEALDSSITESPGPIHVMNMGYFLVPR